MFAEFDAGSNTPITIVVDNKAISSIKAAFRSVVLGKRLTVGLQICYQRKTNYVNLQQDHIGH